MLYDVIVIGGGPAGLTAAATLAQQNLRCMLVANSIGGQLNIASTVRNWPVQEKISGKALLSQLMKRFKASSITIDLKKNTQVEGVHPVRHGSGLPTYTVITNTGDRLQAQAVILAMGTRHRSLGLPGEERLTGKGVSYCAICDAPYFKNKVVAVLGDSIEVASVAHDLSRIASQVYILQSGKKLGQQPKNVKVLWGTSPVAILGQGRVAGLKYLEDKTGQAKEINLDGVFIESGSEPNSELVKDLVETDGNGQVVVDHQTMATSGLGIYAAGDITDSHFKQVSLATADGIRAALSAAQYITAIKEAKGGLMVQVTLISPADCPNCAAVKEQLDDLKVIYPELIIKSIDAHSPEGEELILQHGILASPGILINDRFFNMGTVSEQRLKLAIKSAAEAV
jgi:thioredoxin reductase/glutaredoxin